MAEEPVRLSMQAQVAWVEYARPPVNAFTQPMVEDVRAALADRGARVLVLASAAPGWRSGARSRSAGA